MNMLEITSEISQEYDRLIDSLIRFTVLACLSVPISSFYDKKILGSHLLKESYLNSEELYYWKRLPNGRKLLFSARIKWDQSKVIFPYQIYCWPKTRSLRESLKWQWSKEGAKDYYNLGDMDLDIVGYATRKLREKL